MDVVFDSANCDGVHAMVGQNASHIRPQFGLELSDDARHPIFGAEHDVNMVANVRAWHRSPSVRGLCRPSGTRILLLPPGHSRARLQIVASLRDWGLKIVLIPVVEAGIEPPAAHC